MNKYFVEFICTFFLVLTIGLTVIGGAGAMAPIAIGFTLIALIYAGSHISGAHYNPAVTLAFWMKGKCSTKSSIKYILVQVIAGIIASLMLAFLIPVKWMAFVENEPITSLQPFSALLAEFLGTFALSWVILNVSLSPKHPNNGFYGIAIGASVIGLIYAFKDISCAAFNPAVAIGISLMGLIEMADIWIFLIANFSGGAVAALAFKPPNTNETFKNCLKT